jgi:protein-tyrosine phosphatase
MGGYGTHDGRQVRWGQLFRSATLAYLTDRDYDHLSTLGIKVVCDLRTVEEREAEPTKWQAGSGTRFIHWDYPAKNNINTPGASEEKSPTSQQMRQRILSSYPNITINHTVHFAVIFEQLAKGNTPLVFNCVSGKDRTGICAALILTALGVENELVVLDYTLSETYVDYIELYTGSDKGHVLPPNLASLPPHLLEPMLRSDPEYLNRAFSHLETSYGSVMGYIREELHVSEAMLASIRQRLLD